MLGGGNTGTNLGVGDVSNEDWPFNRFLCHRRTEKLRQMEVRLRKVDCLLTFQTEL